LTHKKSDKDEGNKKREEKLSAKEIEEKKRKFREFLNVMGVKSSDNKQSWNDSFQEFMNEQPLPFKKSNKRLTEKEVEKNL
jgi:hypothetical protein